MLQGQWLAQWRSARFTLYGSKMAKRYFILQVFVTSKLVFYLIWNTKFYFWSYRAKPSWRCLFCTRTEYNIRKPVNTYRGAKYRIGQQISRSQQNRWCLRLMIQIGLVIALPACQIYCLLLNSGWPISAQAAFANWQNRYKCSNIWKINHNKAMRVLLNHMLLR